VLDLALEALRALGLPPPLVELSDARCVRALLPDPVPQAVLDALAVRSPGALQAAGQYLPHFKALEALLQLEGDASVLDLAQAVLPPLPGIGAALADLRWLGEHLQRSHPELRLAFDLAAVAGNAYYSGASFNAYVPGSSEALIRGGRYDEVGAVFGRRRPAVGFSLDLKVLVDLLPVQALGAAVRAPWSEDPALRALVRSLRAQGETVVWMLPGHEHEAEEYACDRELVRNADNQWALCAI
jgi:ATP phosphoribosyltransferase regulatory subunit